LLGNQSSARDHFERSQADEVRSDGRSDIIRFQIDKRSTRRVYLARILWLLGFVDQAVSAAHCSVEEARAANHAVTLCHALARAACPLAVSVGDLATAEYYAGMLVDHSERHGLPRWRAFGHGYQGILHIGRGSRAIGVQLLRAAFDETKQAGTAFRFMPLMGGEVPEALGRSGQIAEGLALIDEELDRSEHEHAKEHWRTAELLRVKGELALLQGAQGAAATAENYFRQALDWARWQGALSWELRATTSLARLWRDQGRSAEALALLRPAYDRFTEGFDTADLKAAKALLDGLR
jgi:tetratricopeptide (TPR) repeat protein